MTIDYTRLLADLQSQERTQLQELDTTRGIIAAVQTRAGVIPGPTKPANGKAKKVPKANGKPKPPAAVASDGRRSKVSDEQWLTAKNLWVAGERTIVEIANQIGVSDATVHNRAKNYSWPKRGKPASKGKDVSLQSCESCGMKTKRDPCEHCGKPLKWT